MSFEAKVKCAGNEVRITLQGDLDSTSVEALHERLQGLASAGVDRMVLDVTDLDYMSSAGLRELVFLRQKMPGEVEVVIVGATDSVAETIQLTGFDRSVTMRLDEV